MMTDKMIKETLKKEIKARFGYVPEIKLSTKRTCEINGKKLKLRVVMATSDTELDWVETRLREYRNNRTFENAKRVIKAYAAQYMWDFNKKLEEAYDNERKMLRNEVENYFN